MAAHKDTDTAICPHCGNHQTVTVWAIVNGDENTRTKSKIINGTFFNQKCKKCGETFTLLYPTLYEDDTNHTMIYYAQSPMQESIAIQTVMQRRDAVKAEEDYAIRVTSAPEKWREKVNLADDRMSRRELSLPFMPNQDGCFLSFPSTP